MLNIVVYVLGEWDTFHRKPILEALARNGEGILRLLCINAKVTPVTMVKYFIKSMKKRQSGKEKVQQVASNLYVYSPRLWTHSIFRRSGRGIMLYKNRLSMKIQQILEELKINDGKKISWVFRPEQINYLGVARESYVIYDCYDEYQIDASTGKFLSEVQKSENKLLSKTSIVFVTSRSLYEKRRHCHHNVHFVPNGVDVEHFGKALNEYVPIAPELREINKPIIGYPGNLAKFVDVKLLEYIAYSHPDWSLVLLPHFKEQISLSSLKLKENVHIWYGKLYERLPFFSKGFDVVILPFIVNEYLKCSNPQILWEQMAAGNLLVSTNFNEDVNDNDDIIWVSKHNDEFVANIEEALSGNYSNRIEKGLMLAQEHSWDVIAQNKINIITECLGN